MWTSERPFFCLYRTYTPLLSLIDLLPFQFQCSDQVPFPSDLSIPLRPFQFSTDRHATQVDRLIDAKILYPCVTFYVPFISLTYFTPRDRETSHNCSSSD
jgi:hypothetical protein